jgi:hypothetical protein
LSDRDRLAKLSKPTPNPEVLPWRGRYSGRVAILCGGLSAGKQPLERIACPILGVNASWHRIQFPRTFAHLLSSWQYADACRAQFEGRWAELPVFQKTWGGHAGLWPSAIPLRKRDGEVFRLDLEHGIWTCAAPIVALELLVYLGFTELVFVGLDLKLPGNGFTHWWDHARDTPANNEWAKKMHLIQRRALVVCRDTLRRERPDVRVINVSPDTACEAFPSTPFDEVFA